MMVMGVVVPLSVSRVVDGAGMGWAYAIMSAGDLISVALLTLVKPPVRERAERSPLLSKTSSRERSFR